MITTAEDYFPLVLFLIIALDNEGNRDYLSRLVIKGT